MTDSTTDEGAVNTGDSDESLPADNTNAADDTQDANSGGETQDDSDQGGQDEGSEDQKTESKTDDDGLAKFAKSQGFDPANLTDGERRALKIAHDNQREFHKKRREEADALRKSVADLHDPANAAEGEEDDYVKEQKQLRAEMTQLKQYQRVNEFWREHPEAREYENEMNELVLQEKKDNGLEAAIYLSRNLDRLYKLAKADRQDPDALKDAGRREEREALRKRQEGSADTGSASSNSSRSNKGVNEEWIANTYDPSNPEHVKMLDAYLQKQ